MHQGSLSELQGVSPQRGPSPRRTTRPSGGYTQRGLCPPRGAPLWAWLVLGALVLPGAWSFLTDEQEEMLVELHNHYRGQVTPSASAMMPLKWDPNLKLLAEGYAAKCIWNHNAELEDTGENLFVGTGPLDLREALEKWFLEYMHYDYQNNSCDEDMMCGHYTQMVWADTHRVGCAFHLCNNMENLDWERVSFLVCNYYPAGNYEDQRPYVEGDWCSSCPENLQKCENNLCVPETDDEDVSEEDDEEDVVEEETVVPPAATSDPSPQPPAEQDEEEQAAPPPPPTIDSDVQPAATTTAGDTEDNKEAEDTADPESTPPPAIPDPDIVLPDKPSTTLNTVERVEEKKEEEATKAEDKMRTDISDTTKEKVERDESENLKTSTRRRSGGMAMSAGSVSSSSLLFACLLAILTTRL